MMAVEVRFRSGEMATYIVPRTITVVAFRDMLPPYPVKEFRILR